MHWLFLLLGFAAMVVAFKTTSSGLMAICLIAALVLFMLWLAGLYSLRSDDVYVLAKLCNERGVEFNIEGNPFAPPRDGYPGLLALCEATRPAQVTLVPDGDGQLTSDHGFDFTRDGASLAPSIASFKALGCRVSVFGTASRPRGAVYRAVRGSLRHRQCHCRNCGGCGNCATCASSRPCRQCRT